MTDLSVSSELLTSNKASLIVSRSSSTPGEAGVVVGTGIGSSLLGTGAASSASVKVRASSAYPSISSSSGGLSNSHGSAGGGLEPHTSSEGTHTSSISHSTTTGSNTLHHHHPHQGQVQGATLSTSSVPHPHHHPPHLPHNLSQQPSPMEVFNLRWDEYHRIVIDSFWSLFTEESLVDCTLVSSLRYFIHSFV